MRRYAELGGAQQPAVTSGVADALLDGLFQKHLRRHIAGDAQAISALQAEVRQLFPMLA